MTARKKRPAHRIIFDNPPGPDSGFTVFSPTSRGTQEVYYAGRGLMSVEEAAEVLGVHRSTVYRWIELREVRALTHREATKIPNSEVKRLLMEG